MNQSIDGLHGVVRGNAIEFEGVLGLPEGQAVSVNVRPVPAAAILARGEAEFLKGIRASAGGWDDDPDGLDAYLAQCRASRHADRPPIDP